ncbi:MAG TPA: response regulator transcription factor [Phycisphaerae bacterium]|nr:response regulator transcription factor [Phycisphaerae bacterium]
MPAKLDGRSILVVDDDPDIVATVKMAFEASGAKVTTARDGNKAVELARSINPDLIILDMMMPKRSGFLVMETLKPQRKAGTKPFVIMITANEGKRHEQYARYLGVDEYVNKPFSMDMILERSCELLGGDFSEPDHAPPK